MQKQTHFPFCSPLLIVFTHYPYCVYRLITIPAWLFSKCLCFFKDVMRKILLDLQRAFGFEVRGCLCLDVDQSHVLTQTKKISMHTPIFSQCRTSVGPVCCLKSGTHRLNDSRLSLLSLLATGTIDLHNKQTQTDRISSLLLLSPSSCHPPDLQVHCVIELLFTCPI